MPTLDWSPVLVHQSRPTLDCIYYSYHSQRVTRFLLPRKNCSSRSKTKVTVIDCVFYVEMEFILYHYRGVVIEVVTTVTAVLPR